MDNSRHYYAPRVTFDDNINIEYQRIILQKILYHTQAQLRHDMVKSHMSIDVTFDKFTRQFVYIMKTYIFGQVTKKTVELELKMPKNWWQMFKRDHIKSKWYLKRYPVLFETIVKREIVEASRLFPKMTSPINHDVIEIITNNL